MTAEPVSCWTCDRADLLEKDVHKCKNPNCDLSVCLECFDNGGKVVEASCCKAPACSACFDAQTCEYCDGPCCTYCCDESQCNQCTNPDTKLCPSCMSTCYLCKDNVCPNHSKSFNAEGADADLSDDASSITICANCKPKRAKRSQN